MSEWCPTQAGQMYGYEPEFREGNGEWKLVPVVKVIGGNGVNQPLLFGGITDAIGLYGYAQAQALAWKFAADMASIGKSIEVRVVDYEIHYDIKAKKVFDDPARPHDPPAD